MKAPIPNEQNGNKTLPKRPRTRNPLHPFMHTNLSFQTFLKFNQQTFRKSLTKNASQLRGKESFTKETIFLIKLFSKTFVNAFSKRVVMNLFI